MRRTLFRLSLSFGLCLATMAAVVGSPARAQGRTDYMNVESPHVHPLEVVRIGGYDYILVCNTADGTVEILDTNEMIPPASRRLARVRVGQEPVSVRFNANLGRFYTANFLGDSVSVVNITAPSGPTSLAVQLEQTTFVGDEPLDISFVDNAGTPTVIITHMSLDAFGWRDAVTLAPVIPGLSERLAATLAVGTTTFALKEPRTTLVNNQALYILGGKGGNTAAYDFDIWLVNLATSAFQGISGVGTTNFNMALASNGDLFVVAQDALNRVLQPEPVVAAACTGFSPSILTWIQNPVSATPTILTRDLNAMAPAGGCNPVAKNMALTQPTDLALLESSGTVQKVFVSAISSDRIGVFVPNSATPISWPRTTINVTPLGAASPKAGPVALALKAANLGVSTDPGQRLYVLNRFDYSVTIIDPVAEIVVGGIPLAVDPRPAHVLAGQHFLYDAEQSGNGFSACSTCHPYGRTDGLIWDLGSPGQPQSAFGLNFADGLVEFDMSGNQVFGQLLDNLNNGFSDDKGFMMTQSLQGLLNFEVRLLDRGFTSNAPYYWRGTRFDFPDFNGGFQNLMLGPGLSQPDMDAYQEFINTIHYPPNPQQPKDRVFSGTVGATPGTSTGAQSGLELYHERPLCNTPGCLSEAEANRSCVHCHALPEGSNNRSTEFLGNLKNPGSMNPSSDTIAVETAALRGLFQKEARLDLNGLQISGIVTGNEGLSHTGANSSINQFNSIFTAFFPGATELVELNQFVHEFDWGVGPLVGFPLTVDSTNVATALNVTGTLACGDPSSPSFNPILCMEGQADVANAGLAVQALLGGTATGFWYDPSVTPPLYRQEPAGLNLSTVALLNQVGPGDRLIFQAVPLGSERRIASPTGVTASVSAAPPSVVTLLPMVPNTAYQRVPTLTGNWNNFTWPFTPLPPQAIFPHTIKLFQHGLIQFGVAQNGFGLGMPGTPLRHDAPRRFRVAGMDIRPGAALLLNIPNDPAAVPPNPVGPLSQMITHELLLPLYPTTEREVGTNFPVWQTAVEIEPLIYYGMMLGGAFAPGVAASFNDWLGNIPEPPTTPGFFDPLNWNFHFVRVLNEDGSVSPGSWQPIFVQ